MKFKLLNLNLYEGGLLFDNILHFFNQEKPDILTLQEVHNSHNPRYKKNFRSLEILKQHFLNFHNYFVPELKIAYNDQLKVDIGNAIFSRWPISHTQSVFLSKQTFTELPKEPSNSNWSDYPQNMISAKISIKGKTLNLFNLHGIWGKDGTDNQSRLRMSRIIVNQIKDKNNVVLAGDFNLRPNTQSVKNIEQHLVNIFKGEHQTTFNIPMKRQHKPKYPDHVIEGYSQSVVDMVFTSPNLKVLKKSCPQVNISDHLPLVCTIEF